MESIRNARIPEVFEGWRRGEEGTMLMVYRMTESEEMAQYRDTYGPIMRLTRTEITDYLGNLLEEKASADEEQRMLITMKFNSMNEVWNLSMKWKKGV